MNFNDNKGRSFDRLSRVTRRKYLRALAEQALLRYGVRDAAIRYITDLNNVVFRITSGSSLYSLRIHPPDRYTNEAIEAELSWLAGIRADTGLLVPRPVPGTDGSFVQMVPIPKKNASRQVVLFEWIRGKLLSRDLTRRRVIQAGRFMARLHRYTEDFAFPQGAFRPRLDWGELRTWPNWGQHNIGRLSTADDALCRNTARRLSKEMEKLETQTDYGLIHGDLHPWNYVVHGDEIGAIDFDDCWHAPFVYDVATPLFFWLDHKNYQALRDAFFDGYTAVRPLPAAWETGIGFSIRCRSLSIIDWMLSWPISPEGDALWVYNIALNRIRSLPANLTT